MKNIFAFAIAALTFLASCQPSNSHQNPSETPQKVLVNEETTSQQKMPRMAMLAENWMKAAIEQDIRKMKDCDNKTKALNAYMRADQRGGVITDNLTRDLGLVIVRNCPCYEGWDSYNTCPWPPKLDLIDIIIELDDYFNIEDGNGQPIIDKRDEEKLNEQHKAVKVKFDGDYKGPVKIILKRNGRVYDVDGEINKNGFIIK